MTTWEDIVNNFKTLMEQTIGGYHYSKVSDMTRLSTMPASNWNKTYMVLFGGMPAPMSLYSGIVDLYYTVTLQIAYKLNQNDGNVSYNNAIEDVESVIVKRLTTTTWNSAANIINITHVSTSPAIFTLQNNSDEVFAVVNITFLVSGRQSM